LRILKTFLKPSTSVGTQKPVVKDNTHPSKRQSILFNTAPRLEELTEINEKIANPAGKDESVNQRYNIYLHII
jgi:hypothetical protein